MEDSANITLNCPFNTTNEVSHEGHGIVDVNDLIVSPQFVNKVARIILLRDRHPQTQSGNMIHLTQHQVTGVLTLRVVRLGISEVILAPARIRIGAMADIRKMRRGPKVDTAGTELNQTNLALSTSIGQHDGQSGIGSGSFFSVVLTPINIGAASLADAIDQNVWLIGV